MPGRTEQVAAAVPLRDTQMMMVRAGRLQSAQQMVSAGLVLLTDAFILSSHLGNAPLLGFVLSGEEDWSDAPP